MLEQTILDSLIRKFQKKPDATTTDVEYGFQNKIPLWLFGFMY
jgi:hypothetical protein